MMSSFSLEKNHLQILLRNKIKQHKQIRNRCMSLSCDKDFFITCSVIESVIVCFLFISSIKKLIRLFFQMNPPIVFYIGMIDVYSRFVVGRALTNMRIGTIMYLFLLFFISIYFFCCLNCFSCRFIGENLWKYYSMFLRLLYSF
jgi:hypothetical protein